MKKYQKEAEKAVLEHEEKIRAQLAESYREALRDVQKRLKELLKDPGNQQKIMRADSQKQLEADLKRLLKGLGDTSVEDVEEYLQKVYEDSFLGTVYGFHQEKVPIVLMVNETQMRKTVEKETADFKFSQRLYRNRDKLVSDVKKQLSRGIASGAAYRDIARELAAVSEANLKQSWRIVRTEGHRVQNEAKMDCMRGAKEAGADVVKQWDSTVDARTRPTHRELDGQTRELDEPFVVPSTGAKAMYPGGFGIAKEDIWCRCAMLQIPRWAISEEEQKYSKLSGKIISTKSRTYKDWKEEYTRIIQAPYVSGDRATEENIKSLEGIRDGMYSVLETSGADEGHVAAFRYYESMAEYVLDSSYQGIVGYYPNSDTIRVNLENLRAYAYDENYALTHEVSHRMDFLQYKSFESEDFLEAVEASRKTVYNNLEAVKGWFESGGKYEESYAMSDIISALTENEVHGNYGHKAEYWKEKDMVSMEIFANISAADLCGFSEMEEFRDGGMLHSLYQAYRRLIG